MAATGGWSEWASENRAVGRPRWHHAADSTGQEVPGGAAATVSVMDRWGKRLGTVYLGQMPEAQQVTISEELTRLIQDVLAAWQGPSLRLVYVTDAGFHPSEYFAKVLSRLPNPHRPGTYYQWEWVVDYYHACQYISQLGEVIFGKGRAAQGWSAKMRRVLRDKPSGIFRVLRSAGALRTIRKLAGKESDYQTAYAWDDENYVSAWHGSIC